jgi:hypothetical protein
MVGFGTGKAVVAHFAGDTADEPCEPECFFAFFLWAFLCVPDFAGAEVAADAWGADGEAGEVPCANATAQNAVATSAASKCFFTLNPMENDTPEPRVVAINGRVFATVDIGRLPRRRPLPSFYLANQ